MKVLLTGGAGFVGQHLKARLLADGYSCVSLDLEPDATSHPNLLAVRGDVRDPDLLRRLFTEHRFELVFHCAAAMVLHTISDKNFVRTTNVDGTRHVGQIAREHGAKKVVFVSTQCLWTEKMGRLVTEADTPDPKELYGATKWEAEKILWAEREAIDIGIIRSPTVIDTGRLGLMTILFEFIEEGRRVWVVGRGDNRPQFVSAGDLSDACVRVAETPGSDILNVGSDDVKPLRDVYQFVIARAGTGARIAHLPRLPTLLGMRMAFRLGMSPLGPYQYKMIAEDFIFDTTKIKEKLGWRPTLTNEEMLWRAYEYYRNNRDELRSRTDLSIHRRPVSLGVIRILKWVS